MMLTEIMIGNTDPVSRALTEFMVTTSLGMAILFYFVPSILAMIRHHRQRSAIFVLNIFLGWTVIGWVGALVWSFTKPTQIQ
jgi:hypothetical protein